MATSTDLIKQIQQKNFVGAKQTFNALVAEKLTSAIRNEYRATAKELFGEAVGNPKSVKEASDPDFGKKNKDTSWWKDRDKNCDADPDEIYTAKSTPHMECGIKCQE